MRPHRSSLSPFPLRACSRALAARLTLAAGALHATTIHGPADVATLTRASVAVVRARVVSRQSHFGAGGEKSGLIFTTVELEALEQWSGDPVDARIAVRTPGGAAGALEQEVVGAPTFAEGEEVVLFLRLRAPASARRLALYEVSRWALGKFTVRAATPGAPVRVRRDRSGVECVGCAAGERDELSLDELREQVRAAAQERP